VQGLRAACGDQLRSGAPWPCHTHPPAPTLCRSAANVPGRGLCRAAASPRCHDRGCQWAKPRGHWWAARFPGQRQGSSPGKRFSGETREVSREKRTSWTRARRQICAQTLGSTSQAFRRTTPVTSWLRVLKTHLKHRINSGGK